MLLISSFTPITQPQFDGFCWVGADLVVGQNGAEKYQAETGRSISFGQDGCYSLMAYESGEWRIGTDSRGLAKLYLYQKGDEWAVCSSFYGLVTYLRSKGEKLTPRLGLLAAYSARRGFADQLTASTAIFEEINLIPTFATIAVTADGPYVKVRPPAPEIPYEEALFNFVSTWRSRLSTVLNDETVMLQLDLSGGIDSRTVLAFALADGNFDPKSGRCRLVSTRSKEKDFEIATLVADRYGLELSPGRRRNRKNLSEARALEDWRHQSLGVYLPLYFHGETLDPTNIHAHGAGGGNFRPYYVGRDAVSQVEQDRRRMGHPEHFEEWKEITRESSTKLNEHRPHVSPLILHYREFRNRFHFGHRPHSNIVFMPLESELTDQITDRGDGRNERQIYFDVMESLAPGLKDLPFDVEDKSPELEIIRNLTVADLEAPQPGRIFGTPTTAPSIDEIPSAYQYWVEEGFDILQRHHVKDFIGEGTLKSALIPIKEARHHGKRLHSHENNLLNLSYARTVAFILGE